MRNLFLAVVVMVFAALAFSAEVVTQKPDETAQDYEQRVTFANRAPVASDKGLLWVKETSGTTSFYTRNRTSGTWTLIGP